MLPSYPTLFLAARLLAFAVVVGFAGFAIPVARAVGPGTGAVRPILAHGLPPIIHSRQCASFCSITQSRDGRKRLWSEGSVPESRHFSGKTLHGKAGDEAALPGADRPSSPRFTEAQGRIDAGLRGMPRYGAERSAGRRSPCRLADSSAGSPVATFWASLHGQPALSLSKGCPLIRWSWQVP